MAWFLIFVYYCMRITLQSFSSIPTHSRFSSFLTHCTWSSHQNWKIYFSSCHLSPPEFHHLPSSIFSQIILSWISHPSPFSSAQSYPKVTSPSSSLENEGSMCSSSKWTDQICLQDKPHKRLDPLQWNILHEKHDHIWNEYSSLSWKEDSCK